MAERLGARRIGQRRVGYQVASRRPTHLHRALPNNRDDSLPGPGPSSAAAAAVCAGIASAAPRHVATSRLATSPCSVAGPQLGRIFTAPANVKGAIPSAWASTAATAGAVATEASGATPQGLHSAPTSAAAVAASADAGTDPGPTGSAEDQPHDVPPQDHKPAPNPPASPLFTAVAAASRRGRGAQGAQCAEGAPRAAAGGAVRTRADAHTARGGADYARTPDGRALVVVHLQRPAGHTAGDLSMALGVERRAVVRFDGAAGGLKGMRVLTLANMFMGGFRRALSFVADVRPISHDHQPNNQLMDRPQAGDISFAYRILARSRALEPHEDKLPAAMRSARFVLDLSINVRQAWDAKGDVDEEQAYDLADTFYAALAAQQAEQEAEEEAAALRGAGGGRVGAAAGRRYAAEAEQEPGPPPYIYVTTDLAQGLTTLTALALLQKRLREEGQQVVAEATLYRASVAAPRLDGRDGWVFAIRLGFEYPYAPPPPPSMPPMPPPPAPAPEMAASPARAPNAQRDGGMTMPRGGRGGSGRGGGRGGDRGRARAPAAAGAEPAAVGAAARTDKGDGAGPKA